ncbi:MAG: STAS domain-containing protein [Leptospirales bacterium]
MSTVNLFIKHRMGATEFIITGRLDADQILTLESEIIKEIEEHPEPVFAVNLTKLGYMDTAGLSLLIKLRKYLEKTSHVLLLFGANINVLSIIKMARLEQLLQSINEGSFYIEYPLKQGIAS